VHPVDLVLVLLVALVGLVAIARRLRISYPIILVLGGLALAIPPRMPTVSLDPDIVFLLFLPPLLFSDALSSSWRDFKEYRRPIFLLAVGLVFATTAVVVLVAHFCCGMAWGPSFVLGAVLGPTDTVAVSAVLEQFQIPRGLLAVLRGESLVNDASALVLFEAAIRTTQLKTYVWGLVMANFCLAVAGGVLIGWLVAGVALELRRRMSDSLLANTISLLTPFAAYQAAAAIHASGVLAVVTAGLYFGWNDPRIGTARGRIQASGTWEIVTFLLNGLLFILIGLQLRPVSQALWSQRPWFLIGGSLAVSATVILVRIAWVFASSYLSRRFRQENRSGDGKARNQEAILLSWVGIRGGISLAAALSIPPVLAGGTAFPNRAEILVFTFAAILITLVVQGLTLQMVVSRLSLAPEPARQVEEVTARSAMAAAALEYLGSVEAYGENRDRAIDYLRESYGPAVPAELENRSSSDASSSQVRGVTGLEMEIVKRQRQRLIELRDSGQISDEILRQYQAVLDLRESTLERSDGGANPPEARP
jgi:monovalent cation/hydrogen antiporter